MSKRPRLVAVLTVFVGVIAGVSVATFAAAVAEPPPPGDRGAQLRQSPACGNDKLIVDVIFELAPLEYSKPKEQRTPEQAIDNFVLTALPGLAERARVRSIDHPSVQRYAILDRGQQKLLVDTVPYGENNWAVNGATGCSEFVAAGRRGVR